MMLALRLRKNAAGNISVCGGMAAGFGRDRKEDLMIG
jgi:hypothetical protein